MEHYLKQNVNINIYFYVQQDRHMLKIQSGIYIKQVMMFYGLRKTRGVGEDPTDCFKTSFYIL